MKSGFPDVAPPKQPCLLRELKKCALLHRRISFIRFSQGLKQNNNANFNALRPILLL